MGMEAVELVIECEDRFRIDISDAEAQRCVTVGDLQDLVVRKTGVQAGATCLSSHVFYRLRRALSSQRTHVQKLRISPDLELRRFFGDSPLRAQWDSLEASSGLVLPALDVPKWFGFALLSTGGIAACLGVVAYAGFPSLWPLSLGFTAVWLALFQRYDAVRSELPEHASTVRELVLRTMSLNLAALATQIRARESEVREAVSQTICDVLFIDREQVVPDANFVADLGVS